ncbi:MAG: Nucleotide-binding protein [Cellulomonadaceae bacterium TMED98]|nr:MAG: Nucleotide-binding protein [Cellulomonadaceae bacterium TMED98]
MSEPASTEVVILTGMSGAGRSTAANALEDHGWYVVDNLPPQMLEPLIDLADQDAENLARLACVVDARGGQFFDRARDAIIALSARSNVTVVFLDASDDVLVRRFEQVRRPHPLQGDGTLLDGLSREREVMQQVREASDVLVDTTDLTVHQLTNSVSERFTGEKAPGVALTVMSFGFKYGIPADADMVWDMRFLPNPYWSPALRPLTGMEEPVAEYVMQQTGATDFLDAQLDALRVVLDGYLRENKRFATLALGCTGGRHRSVATVQYVSQVLGTWEGVRATPKHRDLGRE